MLKMYEIEFTLKPIDDKESYVDKRVYAVLTTSPEEALIRFGQVYSREDYNVEFHSITLIVED